jgi:hypothetical protein
MVVKINDSDNVVSLFDLPVCVLILGDNNPFLADFIPDKARGNSKLAPLV